MANTCSILRNKETGEIEKVLAPNGQESILWKSLISIGELSINKEDTLRTWAVAYTTGFKNEFGDWELFQKARELSGSIEKAFYRDLFENEPEQFLFEMAQQLRSSDIEAQAARNVMGNDLAQIALQLFPNSVVGSKYTPQFTGKVDSNGEPLLEHVVSPPGLPWFEDAIPYTQNFEEIQFPDLAKYDDEIMQQLPVKVGAKKQVIKIKGLDVTEMKAKRPKEKKAVFIDSDTFQDIGKFIKDGPKDPTDFRHDIIRIGNNIYVKSGDNLAFKQFYPFLDFSKKYKVRGRTFYYLTNNFVYSPGSSIGASREYSIMKARAIKQGKFGIKPIKTKPRLTKRAKEAIEAFIEKKRSYIPLIKEEIEKFVYQVDKSRQSASDHLRSIANSYESLMDPSHKEEYIKILESRFLRQTEEFFKTYEGDDGEDMIKSTMSTLSNYLQKLPALVLFNMVHDQPVSEFSAMESEIDDEFSEFIYRFSVSSVIPESFISGENGRRISLKSIFDTVNVEIFSDRGLREKLTADEIMKISKSGIFRKVDTSNLKRTKALAVFLEVYDRHGHVAANTFWSAYRKNINTASAEIIQKYFNKNKGREEDYNSIMDDIRDTLKGVDKYSGAYVDSESIEYRTWFSRISSSFVPLIDIAEGIYKSASGSVELHILNRMLLEVPELGDDPYQRFRKIVDLIFTNEEDLSEEDRSVLEYLKTTKAKSLFNNILRAFRELLRFIIYGPDFQSRSAFEALSAQMDKVHEYLAGRNTVFSLQIGTGERKEEIVVNDQVVEIKNTEDRVRYGISSNIEVDTDENGVSETLLERFPEGSTLQYVRVLEAPNLKSVPVDFRFPHQLQKFIAPNLSIQDIPEGEFKSFLLNEMRYVKLKDYEKERLREKGGLGMIFNISSAVSKLYTSGKPKYSFEHKALLKTNLGVGSLPMYTLGENGSVFNIEFGAGANSPFPESLYERFRLDHGLRKLYIDKPIGWFGGVYSVENKTISVTEVQSDLLQRSKTIGELRSKVENYYDGWLYVFTGTAINLLLNYYEDVTHIRIPTSETYKKFKKESPSQYYDKIASVFPTTLSEDGRWHVIKVSDIFGKISPDKKSQFDFMIKAGVRAGVKEQKEITPDLQSDRDNAMDILESLKESEILGSYLKSSPDHVSEIEKWIEREFSNEKPMTDDTKGGELVGPDGEVIEEDEGYEETDMDRLVRETAANKKREYVFDLDWALDELSAAMKNNDTARVNFIKRLLEEHTSGKINFNRSSSGNYKQILSLDNQKIFEELIAKGLITERRWNGMYFVPKQYREPFRRPPFSYLKKDFRDGHFLDKNKYEELKAIIEVRGLSWLDVRPSNSGDSYVVRIFPTRQESMQTRLHEFAGKDAFIKIADRLSKRLGVPYKIIDAEQALKITEDSQIPWNGEGAFAYKGTVYVLQEALSLENAVHEFSHFFIEAVSKESPYLFSKLYKQLKDDPYTRERYLDLVERLYPDLSEEDKVKEVMVRALTDKALGLIDERGNVILEAIRKIFRTLANIIRTLFGVSVKNLNENTTLDQLAAILLGENDGEVLDLGDRNTGFFMNLFPMFNRDIANQLEKLTGSTVKSSIDSFFTVTDAHYQRLRQDKDLEKLKEILSNQKGTTLVSDERQILMRAADFARTLEENMKVDRAALITFAEAIEGQEVIAKKMADHVASVVTDKDMSTQEKLAIFRKYSFITKEWTTVVDLFMKAIKDSPVGRGRNPLSDSIQNMISDYKFIDNKIKDFYKEDGLPSLFREEIEGNIYYQAAMKEQEDRIKELEEAYKKDKNPAIKKKLDKERGLLERYKLTDETLAKYLSGEMGDTNHYSMYLESYTSNPDPIVGHFANWFMKHKFRAQSRAQQRMTAFENKISKIYKKLGYKPKDFQKVSENLVQIETFFDGYRNFKGEERKAWTFINQYGDDANGVGWQFEYNRLLQERESAKQRMHSPLRAPGYENMTGEEEYRRKNQAFEQFKLDYMFDEEADVIKEARLFWFRDANTHKAKMRREEVLNEIRALDYKDFSKDEALEKVTQSKALWRKYRQLGSIYDEMGNKKEGDELEIALTIREYNEKYGNLYEYVEISGAFESNLKSHEQQVADDLMSSGNYKTEAEAKASPEFRAAIQKWYRDNIRITLTETFYKERSDIAERLKAFSESLGDQKIKKNLEEVSEAWSEINRIIQGNRDDDRQPIGTDLSDEQRKRVLELQQKVMDLNSAFNQANNLSDEEDIEYGQYVLKNKVFFMELTEQEYARMKELEEKAGIKLTKDQYLEKKKIFDDLNALQSKIATPYYVDTVNDFLAASGSELRITPLSADELLTAEVIQPILRKNPEFRKWWNENHLEKQIYDKTVDAVVLKYNRSYVWNRNVPNDEMFKTLLDNGDYEGLSRYKSPYLEVKPAQEYFYRRLKPEFRHFQSRETLWITHDNRGNWLPKPTEATATPAQKEYMLKHKIPFAKPRFENKKYLDLRENKKDEFELLEAFKQFHLESQQDLARYARLGLEVPRLRKNSVENVDLSKLADKPKDWWNNIKGWLGAMFMKRQDDYELGTGSYIAPANRAQTYVLSDLMGDQINSIPIKYMSHVETDLVSMDIGKAVEMYAVSAETNKVLHEINPMANALKEVLSDPENKPKDLTKKRRNIIKIITDPLKGSTNNNANKKGNYNRLKIIENFLERELEGEVNIQQFGPFIEKIAHGLMKIGAWGSLGGNIFAALKNAVGGQIQNNLESVMGQKFTPKTMMQADLEFGKLMVDLMRDYYQIGDKSLYTQMFILFDPLNFFTQKAGSNFSKTVTRDALDLRWIMGMQKFGEINIQGSAWLAMMLHQKVAFTDPHSGVQKEIPYLEAWELKDGVLSLKKGVDSKWDRGNSNFLQFSASVHKVNELNQGAYSEESQPEINRYTLGKLFLFMRKFYIPASVNRFAPKRYNAGLGSFRQGYWMPLFEMIKNTATGHPLMPGTDDFKVMYSASERAAALRAASELATIALIGLMIKALGFNDSDDEKYDKLKDNDWFHNFAIYQLMLIKSEAETFIPLFGMGINETVRFLGTPTIAFNTARRWVKLANDFVLWTIGSDAAFYQQASGIYDEGQIKYLADLYNIIGWKNFAYITSNEDLQKGIVMYSAMQKRI